jgi:hypothetical protein
MSVAPAPLAVAWVVVRAPVAAWGSKLFEAWEALNALAGAAPGQWEVTVFERGRGLESGGTSSHLSEARWRTLRQRLLDGKVRSLHARSGNPLELAVSAEAVALWSPPTGTSPALARWLYTGIDAAVESEHQPRCVRLGARADLLSDRSRHAWLVAVTRDLFIAGDGCWAHLALEPAVERPHLDAASRSWHEIRPFITASAPCAAATVLLGREQIDALGGPDRAAPRLAAFSPQPIPGGAAAPSGLVLTAMDHPAAVEDPALAPLREALAPILMRTPLTPALTVLVVGDGPLARLRAAAELPGAELPDGTWRIDIDPAPARRTDPAAGDAAARHQRFYALVPEATALGKHAAPLLLPRLLGPRTFMRLGPSDRPAGVPVVDTGEPLDGDLLVSLVGTRAFAGARQAAYQGAVDRWAEVVRAPSPPRIAWSGDRGQLRLAAELGRGDPLLAFILLVDRAARDVRKPDLVGLVAGALPDPRRAVERFQSGVQPASDDAFLPLYA